MKRITHRALVIAALLTFAAALSSSAAQLVRELWDNIPVGQLSGATNGTTSLGFQAAAKWTVNTSSTSVTNVLRVVADDAWDFYMGMYDAMLPPSAGTVGTLGLLTGNTNGWDSGSWAVRRFATGSGINFSANGVYYFSARLIKRGLWWTSNGTNGYGADDAALGLGFASSTSSTAHFVGAGLTRTVAFNGGGGYLTADGATDIGDSVYISTGTLGQAGYANHPGDSGGPYYVRAYGPLQQVEGYLNGSPYVNGAFVVGKITTTATGASQMDVRAFVPGDLVPSDPSLVTWDATSSFTETSTLNYLLVWMHGNNNGNPCYVDAIRASTNWAEVIGEEIVGPPSISPAKSVYAGTPVSMSVFAQLHPVDGEFQWMKNGVNIDAATAATYSIADPVVADSGTYSVVFQNEFSLSLTSEVQTLTIMPAIAPFVTIQPVGGTRFEGAASFTFGVTADGAQPFTYQWKHIVGSTTNVLADQTGQTLTLNNIQASDAGSYFVTISNQIGSTNSVPAVLNVLVPGPGSYAAAVVANSPYAYWPMGETNGTILSDYYGGHDGTVLDPTNITLGITGAAGQGFASDHRAVFIPNNSYQARVNMPALPCYSNTMTFACWLYTPSSPTANGLIYARDTNGWGSDTYGLQFTSYESSPGVTDNNQLGYQWASYQWTNSGLYVPLRTWTFAALVLDGSQATLYMGTNAGPLSVATAAVPAALDSSFPGTSSANTYPLLIGRTGWPWAESSTNNAWANASVTMSDVAIFYSALPASSINDLYLSALGEALTYTYTGSGLELSWPTGTLQAAGQVEGTYTNVPSATSPWPVPTSPGQMFYRTQR
jgi:Concanavalin A-like lectin/glucanases superfamily